MNDLCPICRTEGETTIHALRDCPVNKDVWKMLIKPSFWPDFFNGNMIERIMFNSKKEIEKIENTNWKLTFEEAVRKIWLRRNAFIFNHKACDTSDLYWSIILAVKDFEDSMDVLSFSNSISREVMVRWKPPAVDWVKCNVDGASREDGFAAGCGGAIRDQHGKWVSGFTLSIGARDALSAEVWSIATGMELAWDKGCRRVCIESDSKEAIEIVKAGGEPDHPLASIVMHIKEMMNRDWEISFEHTYREGNGVAHWLAMAALESNAGLRVMAEPPERLKCILRRNLDHFGQPRRIFPVG